MRARSIVKNTFASGVIAMCAAFSAGCYEDLSPDSPQAQQQPVAGQHEGPITSMSNQGNSALGGAKRAATNTIEQAQQKSQEVADQADEMLEDN
jgi:hypothetical protein